MDVVKKRDGETYVIKVVSPEEQNQVLSSSDIEMDARARQAVKAAKYVDKKRYSSIENKEDFTFETVLSSTYKLDILKKAKQEGYFIKCVFVLTIDPHINISRVETRVALGGHDVDKKKIVERYYKSLDNIKQLMKICDILHVYDNTTQPTRIIRKHKEEVSIFPNENLFFQMRIGRKSRLWN